MDKNNFGAYGAIIAATLVLSIMIVFAAPFGEAITNGVAGVLNDFGNLGADAMPNTFTSNNNNSGDKEPDKETGGDNTGEDNNGGEAVQPPVDETPKYVVKILDEEYVAGKRLVLVGADTPELVFAYSGKTMYDLTSKYEVPEYSFVYGIVVDTISSGTSSDYAANVTYTEGVLAAKYVISFDKNNIKNNCDLNNSGTVDGSDIIVINGVLSAYAPYFTGNMDAVLKSDVNGDGVVNETDSNWVQGKEQQGGVEAGGGSGDVVVPEPDVPGFAVYNITVSVANGTYSGDTTIEDGGMALITLAANSNYELPDTVTVTGADFRYTKGSGMIEITAPTQDVTIFVQCRSTTPVPEGVPEGYRLLTADDVGKTFCGVFVDTSVSPVTMLDAGDSTLLAFLTEAGTIESMITMEGNDILLDTLDNIWSKYEGWGDLALKDIVSTESFSPSYILDAEWNNWLYVKE